MTVLNGHYIFELNIKYEKHLTKSNTNKLHKPHYQFGVINSR